MHLLYLQDLNGKPLQILISEDQFKWLLFLSYADMSSNSIFCDYKLVPLSKLKGPLDHWIGIFPNPVDHWFKL